MRMSLIGYGSFQYEMKSGERVVWPIIGVALQKNYLKAGINNFSFVTFDQLDRNAVAALVKDIEETVQQNPIGSLRYSTSRIVSSSAGSATA